MNISIKEISWDEIYPIWRNHLWPTLEKIETHSALVWPYGGHNETHDMHIFDRFVTFWGAFDGDRLVGVNSGHLTSDTEYRHRGIWVDADYRGQGIAANMLSVMETSAIEDDEAGLIWAFPRLQNVNIYKRLGYRTIEGSFGTETSPANIYVVKYLS